MAKNPAKEKLIRTEQLDGFYISSFEGPIESILDRLIGFKQDKEADGYFNIRFNIEYNYEDVELEALGDRSETDEEFEDRMEIHKKFEEKKKAEAAKKEAAERELYENLKRKYGNG